MPAAVVSDTRVLLGSPACPACPASPVSLAVALVVAAAAGDAIASVVVGTCLCRDFGVVAGPVGEDWGVAIEAGI